jgi:hypothetical protein
VTVEAVVSCVVRLCCPVSGYRLFGEHAVSMEDEDGTNIFILNIGTACYSRSVTNQISQSEQLACYKPMRLLYRFE